jgi:DNA-binding transcriptional ArsR family regulator
MWDETYRALADPQRRAILKRLRAQPRLAGELAEHLSIAPSTLSHHLAQLKTAGLVRCEKRGTQRLYSINTSVIEDLTADLLSLRDTGK